MPIYEYEHLKKSARCPSFEIVQSMADDALAVCPTCGKPVRRVIGPVAISSPTGDSKLKSMGFTKLVRRDKGVYENVTALDGESKTFEAGKPETMPDLKRRIED